jgi:NAD(P)-dependent dehydrogenase (short-subunit alcohol dehydrogenase family)
MSINLSKPVIFITGGSRGIGKAIIEKFQYHDWQVSTCATSEESAKSCHADLNLVCDVGNSSHVRNAINAILTKFGHLNAVINNAGIAGSNSLNANDNDDLWHQIINTNLNGTYYVCKYALPHLPDHGGRIVNISSVLGLKGAPDQTAYCSAKHAVLGFTKALAQKTASRGITVNAICPGWVRTDMAIHRIKELKQTENTISRSVPLGKIIEPQEIADLAYYLVTSKAATNMTGEAITIDGGVSA